MDLGGVLWVPLRRWYVLAPLLILTLFGVVGVYFSAPPAYFSRASVVLLMPSRGATEYANGHQRPPENQLAVYDNGLKLGAALLVQIMRKPEFQDSIGLQRDGSTELTVTNGADPPQLLLNSSFVYISAESDSPRAAYELVRKAVPAAREALERAQAEIGAPPTTRVSFEEVVAPTVPTRSRKDGARSGAVLLVVGVVTAVLSTFVVDNLSRRNRPSGFRIRRRAAGALAQPSIP